MQRVSSVETSPLPPTSTLPFVPRSTVSGLGVPLMDPLTLRRIAASNLYFSLNVAHVGPGRGIRTCDLMLGLRVSVAAICLQLPDASPTAASHPARTARTCSYLDD